VPTQEAVVRPATAADLADVAAIYAHYVLGTVATFDEVPPAVADWRRRLGEAADRNLPFLVATASGRVAGYAYAVPWRPKPAYRYTVEDSVYLAPEHTRRGLGRALLAALLPGCADAGARQVVAVIADAPGAGGDASAALHRAFGFAEAGRLRSVGRKHGRWIDTVLMQRELTPARAETG
jgi:L-amino acid N-acyltransferase YncA